MPLIIILMVLCTTAATAEIVDSSANLSVFNRRLDALVADALKNNGQVKASRYKTDAAEKGATIARQLDQPGVEIESMQPTSTLRPTELTFRLKQMFPFPGKLGAMAATEEERSKMAGSESKAAEHDLVLKVKSSFFEVYLFDRRQEINTENRNFTRRLIDIARKQYEVGMGTQADILRGQTELSKLQNDSIALYEGRQSIVAMINALLNRPVTSEIPVVAEILPDPVSITFPQVETIADQNRPELQAMSANVKMQQAENVVNRRERYPDFEIKGGYTRQFPTANAMGLSVEDSWGVMAGMTLPLAPWSGRRYSEAIARGDFRILEAEAVLADIRAMVRAEVQEALLRVASAQEQKNLLRLSVIPQTRQMLESTLSSYQTGKLEFLTLIDAERMLLMAQEQYHMAVMKFLTATAELERAVGADMKTIFDAGRREKTE
jgi:outer membrane protein, heavy metal efflux system